MSDYELFDFKLTIEELKEIIKDQKVLVEINGMYYELVESEDK